MDTCATITPGMKYGIWGDLSYLSETWRFCAFSLDCFQTAGFCPRVYFHFLRSSLVPGRDLS